MKFDKKYPNANYLDQFDIDYIIKGNKEVECWHCKELTTWVEINFEAPLCSEECVKAKWNEYFKACEASPPERIAPKNNNLYKSLMAEISNIKQIWYHGTNRTAARNILKEGFKSGTYFAKHLEDAIGYGGPFVFGVVFEDNVTTLNDIKFWQRIISSRCPRNKIVSFKVYTERTLFKNKEALTRIFESNLKFFNKG